MRIDRMIKAVDAMMVYEENNPDNNGKISRINTLKYYRDYLVSKQNEDLHREAQQTIHQAEKLIKLLKGG